jgi:Ca-activated chloride channel homolog
MTRRIARSAKMTALAATAVAGAVLTASQAPPAIRIASPGEGAYVSGSTRLVAVLDPPSASRSVERITFFANGIQVCSVTRPPFECDWDAGDRIVEHQIRVTAAMRNGERLVQSVRTRGTEFAEHVDVDVVQVTAVVTDGDGRFVKGLRREDFTILEDDKPQEITHFASENIPLEMVTAIDVSSSMELALPRVKQSAKKFLAGLRAQDQVTILAFNDVIFTIARRSTDQSLRERVIDLMRPWGGTALHDVIIKAADILGRQSGRRSIVLFSDGDDQSSLAPLSAAISRAEGSDATIYAIGQGRAVNNRQLQDLMRRLATVSGGRAFFETDEHKLDTIFEEILEDLRNQYLLSYPAPSSQRDGTWHDIKLRVAGGKHKVRARQGYRLTKR